MENACSHNRRRNAQQNRIQLSGGPRNGAVCFPTITPSNSASKDTAHRTRTWGMISTFVPISGGCHKLF